MSNTEPGVTIDGRVDVEYHWSAGIAGSRFFTELRDNGKIMGTKCPECKRVLVPPRIFCEECFVDTDEWVEVSTSGEILTFAESYFGLQGQRLEEPWYIGIIKLDGADGGLFHRIVKGDSEIEIGGRVEAVLADNREGHIMDIVNFKTV
ncbi:MAG TPA: Zn-ribbon domain-containing OB-fold protein [Solirubrobacterales bacterium]|nr:Zn-ribbon domain-containing OB-fold protein [Solirubrobacterales bacterium]